MLVIERESVEREREDYRGEFIIGESVVVERARRFQFQNVGVKNEREWGLVSTEE